MKGISGSIFRVLAFSAVVAASSAIAQPGRGYPPPGQGGGNPGHGGMPPGQARRYDNRNNNNNRPDWHFQGDARERFSQRYSPNVRQWQRRRNRPNFYPGYAIPRTYYVQPVPRNYYSGLQAPPPGYQYGYYGGYVVAYNPTTRIIADVLDLVTAAATR